MFLLQMSHVLRAACTAEEVPSEFPKEVAMVAVQTLERNPAVLGLPQAPSTG